jgi:cytochrome c553
LHIIPRALLAALLASGVSLAGAADLERGKQLVAAAQPACATCHGADFKTPIDPTYPILAGQYADYLAHALVAYRDSANPMMGRNNAVMALQAAHLSDRDIADITAYLASLPGPLVQKK